MSEKSMAKVDEPSSDISRDGSIQEAVAQPVRESGGVLATLRYYENYLDWKMGVEPHGPERITPDKKKPVPIWVMACIWSSGTFSLSSITLGMYGWEYGLSLTESVLIILFASLLGAFVAVS